MVRVRASSAAHTAMEGSGSISDPHRGGGGNSNSNSSNSLTSSSSRWYGMPSPSSIIQAPITALLEYSGLLRPTRSSHQENESLIPGGLGGGGLGSSRLDDLSASAVPNNGEVSIRIIGAGEHERDGSGGLVVGQVVGAQNEVLGQQQMMGSDALQGDLRSDRGGGDAADGAGAQQSSSVSGDGEAADGTGGNGRDSTYQRYDIQQVARWIEQVLPFSLLLLVVFIRQHLQGIICLLFHHLKFSGLCLLDYYNKSERVNHVGES